MDRACSVSRKIRFKLKARALSLFSAVTLGLLFFPQATVSAQTPSTCILRWDIINTPRSFPERNDILPRSEINEIAVASDGKTIYAIDIPDASSGPAVYTSIWRSTDCGISWSPRASRWLMQTAPAPVYPVADIAVAPDDPNFIAAVCADAPAVHRREVYFSQDGGVNWTYSGPIPWLYGPNEQIGDIIISPSYPYQGNNVRDIIVGSRIPANGLAQGEVYILHYPGIGGWKAQGFNPGDIIALALSPNYTDDSTVVIMASTTQRTYIHLGSRDLADNTCYWNTCQGWPVELCTPDQAGGVNSGENWIITGNFSLPADFNGSSVEKRIIFAAYDSNGLSRGPTQTLDDVYRLNDTIVTRLKMPGFGSNPRISSIAYTGTVKAGKLLAGCVRADPATAISTVWFTDNPLSLCPVWIKPLKAPTGGYIPGPGNGFANVKLAWSDDGETAFCGTGWGDRNIPAKWASLADPSWNSQPMDESAFSISLDNSVSWNQLGLIDTEINRFRSVAASADGKTLYISSVNDTGLDSTWRSRSNIAGDTWQRVLCIDCASPVLKPAPDKNDGSCIFVGNQGTTRVVNSRNSGQTWQDCLPGAMVQDIAAGSSSELYVLQANGLVRHGRYDTPGWLWDKFTDTELSPAHTIAAQGNSVLVGAALGQSYPAAYSLDGGNDWVRIAEYAPGVGNKHVAFDEEFKDNHLIYLADDAGGLYRWATSTSHRWDDMAPPHVSYYGIAAGTWGTLYAAYSPLASGVDRTLYAHSGIPKTGPSWDSLTTGLAAGVLFRLEPNSLVLAYETVWAIDARDYTPTLRIGCLWAFHDTLATRSPWLIAPKNNSITGCDPVTGRNAQVDLKWEQLSLAVAYEIEVGMDSFFDMLIAAAEPDTNPMYGPADVLYPAYFITDGALPEAGRSYWWRVRVRRAATGQIIRSRWSRGFSFSIRPGYPVIAPSYPGIQSLQPCQEACQVPVYPVVFSWTPMQGTTSYRFILAGDAELNNSIVDETVRATAYQLNGRLNYRTAYFWQVTPVEPVPGDP
ncbi:MAG: hypothetical protein NT082_05855, partial [Chloroflexi bacterium]|nr:hypothetical protein [Chloroflexota bacterium]